MDTLHLTIHYSSSAEFSAVACESYLWNDSVYTVSGDYTQSFHNIYGADSVMTLHLTVNYGTHNAVTETACESYVWHGITYTTSGTYTYDYTNADGCASTDTLHLTVNHPQHQSETVTAYDSYTWNGENYTQSGDYTYTHVDGNGCMQVDTLHLTIHYSSSAEFSAVACESYLWNDSVYTVSGDYIQSFLDIYGADSIMSLHLTVNYGTHNVETETACESYAWHGTTYTSSGAYTYDYTNGDGCASTDTLHLTVNHGTHNVETETACESYEWHGTNHTTSGTYTYNYTNADGCSSTDTLLLTVNHSSDSILNVSITQNSLPYIFNDSIYYTSGTYYQNLTNTTNCDSILTLNLSVFPNMTVTVDSTVCEGSFPLTWNDSIFTEAGIKITTMLASTGADSNIVMSVMEVFPTNSTLFVTISENNLPLILNDSTYSAEGTYFQHLTNAAGCDSTLTIVLSVLYNVTSQADSTICADALPLTWNGVTFTQAGTQEATLTAANGADSVITMTLTVKPLSDSTLNMSVTQNNLPYTLNSNSYNAAGTYVQHFTNAAGCDSTLTLNLTVFYNVTAQVDTTVCADDLPFTWHGHPFTEVGNHTVTLLTSHGADSVVTYHLAVDNISANVGDVTHITCFGTATGAATATVSSGQTPLTYVWTNSTGTSVSTTTSIGNRPAGTYTFTATDHIGCTASATVTLNTLNGELTPGTIADNQTVCDGESPDEFTGTTASGGDNGAYLWQFSANGTDWISAPGTNNTQNYTYPNPATNAFSLRRVWASQSCGTVHSNTVTISVWPNSSDTATAEVCQGYPYQDNGFDIAAEETSTPGVLTFENHFASGQCDSVVVLLLTVNPNYSEVIEDEACEGDGYDENGFAISPSETVGEDEISRTLTLQSAAGCDSVIQLQLSIIDTSVHIISLTTDFCDALEAELQVITDMPNYVWSTGETSRNITVTHSGHYFVTASEGDCHNTAHFLVESCQNRLLLPNAITPSRGDGLNDYFSIPEANRRDINLFKIWIYNRWGELIYYSTDKNFQWGGHDNKKIIYQSVYSYVIWYTDATGRPFELKGIVTVL